MNALTRDRLKRALKEFQPHSARAILVDDEIQPIARGGPSAPWRPLMNALDELPWSRVELLDKRGALLGAPIKNEAAATELENLPSLSGRITEVGQLAQIVTHNVHQLAQINAAQTRPAFDALVQANKDAHQLADLYREKAENAEARAVKAEADNRRLSERLRKLTEELQELVQGWLDKEDADAEAAAKGTTPQGVMGMIADITRVAPEVAKVVTTLAPMARALMSGKATPAPPNIKAVP